MNDNKTQKQQQLQRKQQLQQPNNSAFQELRHF